METKELFGKTIENGIRIVNDPFKQRCIKEIHMHAFSSSVFDGKFVFFGRVVFENGDTTGEQKFNGKDLGDVFNKIAEFCVTLG